MDRFIGTVSLGAIGVWSYLKSNMDRFIVADRIKYIFLTHI